MRDTRLKGAACQAAAGGALRRRLVCFCGIGRTLVAAFAVGERLLLHYLVSLKPKTERKEDRNDRVVA